MKLKLALVLILLSSRPVLPWGEHMAKMVSQSVPTQSTLSNDDRIIITGVVLVGAVAMTVAMMLDRIGRR